MKTIFTNKERWLRLFSLDHTIPASYANLGHIPCVRRRFRASSYQSTISVKLSICTMPMRLDEGWNQIQFNLSDFTRHAYGANYIETLT